MASPRLHRRRWSIDEPLDLAEVKRLKNEFIEHYETDYHELQECMSRLHDIIKTFEENFRRATKGTRDGAAIGKAGGITMIAGLALAPFTAGLAPLVAAGLAAGVSAGGSITAIISSSVKTRQMTQIRKDIEDELKKFQNKISPMTGKLKDINLRIQKILEELKNLDRDAKDLGKYFASASQNRNIRRENIVQMGNQIQGIVRVFGAIPEIISAAILSIDMFSVTENSKELDDIDKLAKIPIDQQINEHEYQTAAGKFIVEMRKEIHKLQNIMEEFENIKVTLETIC